MRTASPQLARMHSNVVGIGWPSISRGRHGTVAELVRQLDRSQWSSPEDITASQHAQLRVLAGVAVSWTPNLAARLRRAGLAPADLGTPDGLRRLPPMRRQDIQAAGADLFATRVPPDHIPLRAVQSSGSTGEPVTVLRTAINGLLWDALTVRDHLWRDLDLGWRLSTCRPSVARSTERPDWGRPIAPLFATGPSQQIPITVSVEALADALGAFRPEVLVIYPSVLDALLRHLASQGSRLPGLRAVHTVGETLSPALRAATVDALGAGVWDTYSCEEVGNVASSCPDAGGYHVHAESVIVEILDEDDQPCAPGQHGRVVVTDLHNLASPLVRYDIGDYAEAGEPCPCGRGLPVLRRVLGRLRNLVLLPDGSRRWPFSGFHRYHAIVPVRQYQLVQRDRDVVDVNMVVDGPVTAAQEAALTDVIRAGLGHPFELRFTWFDTPLPRGPGGKFEDFRCEVLD